jgi:SAM-dependent methyltransferase
MALTRRGYHALRLARRAGLRVLSPVDYLANSINGKLPFPPLDMRRDVGSLDTFESAAGEVIAALEILAGLGPSSTVLDMGSGCGALPIVMRRRVLTPFVGHYVGLDVDQKLIGWCDRHLTGEHFRFARYHYHNASYNPGGQRFLPFPIADSWADVVVMKSVATHMLPPDVEFYLSEVARVLRPDGRALVSAYLYGEGEDVSATFPHVGEGGHFRYAKAASPESAIALDVGWFVSRVRANGLAHELHPGAQRLVLLRRAGGS